ncbi:MAG: ORF6N domain-containing protein [Rhodospirillaceae bacterium]|nr:ORF6N domain-containing protein [Rhodospirillaceae bacterium]
MPDQTSESPDGGNRQGFQKSTNLAKKGIDMTNIPHGSENGKLPMVSTSPTAVVAYKGVPVMTTERLAQGFHVSPKTINDNFNNNRDRYKEGRDYFLLKGDELKRFKDLYPENFGAQISPMVRSLYLWPERGAFRHCKSIGTDVAWRVRKHRDRSGRRSMQGRR